MLNKMIFSKKLLGLILLLFTFHFAFAQDRCATVQYEEMRKLRNPKKETTEDFEKWLENKLITKRMDAYRTGETQSTFVIPVVVHVIHNGEPVGTGTNISDAQIQSQIEVLNKDYPRLNADAANTPAEFLPVAGSIDIEFVLAKQDPVGAPTNGIMRVKGTQTAYSLNENSEYKALSYWPAENYLNIWVINFSDGNIGYAQFPVSSLPGLEGAPDDRLTDGVTVSYTAFGSIDYGSFNLDPKYNKGRTATHEIGHFLGLRHIWGDDGTACTGTDYVSDTPNQAGSYLNQCPTISRTSCSSSDMYMNYMDYTNDGCMNIFTKEQIGRMNVVLQSSPRRASLLSSPGAQEPLPVGNDVAISKIITPGTVICGDAITPSIEIQNLGSNTVTSVRAVMKVNNTTIETKDFSLTLNYLESTPLNFSSYLPSSSSLQFNFEVTLVNGVADGKTSNNSANISVTVPPLVSLPLTETFNSIPSNWSIYNPDELKTWQTTNIANYGNAVFVNCYDYDNLGAIDRLITPVLDLTNESVAFLKFDYAYAPFDNEYFEQLRVLVSPICDFSNSPLEFFNKSGAELATAPTTSSYFVPNNSQWKSEFISLSQFVGQKIQIAFEVSNGYGNNIYLDNVSVLSDLFLDVALTKLASPSPVSCSNTVNPEVLIKNMGTTPITSVDVRVSINSQSPTVQTLSNIEIGPGEEKEFSLNSLNLPSGTNNVTFTVQNPNGIIDSNNSNNVIDARLVINNSADIIPLRENFDGPFQEQWSVVSQGTQITWESRNTNNNNSLVISAYNYNKTGEESWLVSPVLDFSKYASASVFFDVSYAYRFFGEEKLKVVYSDDCGITFNEVLYQKTGETLSTATSNSNWVPTSESDWRRDYIDLSALAGKSNLRFAFIGEANGGNNLYIDNIEFFTDNNPEPVTSKNSFTAYGAGNDVRVTFNLTERQPVTLLIYNMLGQVMLENTLPETLNQTYYFDLPHFSNGIYIFKAIMGNETSAAKVYLER